MTLKLSLGPYVTRLTLTMEGNEGRACSFIYLFVQQKLGPNPHLVVQVQRPIRREPALTEPETQPVRQTGTKGWVATQSQVPAV